MEPTSVLITMLYMPAQRPFFVIRNNSKKQLETSKKHPIVPNSSDCEITLYQSSTKRMNQNQSVCILLKT